MNFVLFLLATVLFSNGNVFESSQTNRGKVKMKSVSITEQAGINIKTETTLYIDGDSEARYIKETRNIKMLNKVEVSNKHTFFRIDDEFMYSIDLDKKEGVRTKNIKKQFMGDMTKAQEQQFGREMLDVLNAKTKSLGTKIVAGKTCNITQTTSDLIGMKSEVTECKYKDFTLESISNSMGVIVKEEVIFIQENVNIPKEAFQVEEGIPVKTVNW